MTPNLVATTTTYFISQSARQKLCLLPYRNYAGLAILRSDSLRLALWAKPILSFINSGLGQVADVKSDPSARQALLDKAGVGPLGRLELSAGRVALRGKPIPVAWGRVVTTPVSPFQKKTRRVFRPHRALPKKSYALWGIRA